MVFVSNMSLFQNVISEMEIKKILAKIAKQDPFFLNIKQNVYKSVKYHIA